MNHNKQNDHITLKTGARIDADSISDEQLQYLYMQRFSLQAGNSIQNSEEAVLHLRSFFSSDPHREKFVVIFLNGRNRIITTEVLFEGSLTSSAVYPRELIRRIIHHGATAILISHNHPSGNTSPSREDISITSKIKTACSTIDVTVHDHLLIAGSKFTSFADRGLL